MDTANNSSGKKIYLVGKLLGEDKNIPATLMKRGGGGGVAAGGSVKFILATDNRAEAEAVALWNDAMVVEV